MQSPGDTAVFLLPVVAPAGKTCREEGPRHVRRERTRVRLPEDAGGAPFQGRRGQGVVAAPHHARERTLSGHAQEVEALPQG